MPRSLLIVILLCSARIAAAQDVKLSYFDEQLPTFSWYAPAEYDPYFVTDLSERFTLPGESGFVDSVRIMFDSASGARLTISLYRDTLFNTGNGLFHIMNDFVTDPAYASVMIETAEILPGEWITIPMPHVKVPKQFHVRVTAEDDGFDYLSDFAIRGEQEPIHALTTEGARSGFAGVVDDNPFNAILDSSFESVETGDILIGDLWMEAFVDVSSSGVRISPSAHIGIYPNPLVSGQDLHLTQAEDISSVRLIDMLGQEVRNIERFGGSLSTTGLAQGVYQVIVTTRGGTRTEKLVVQ